MQTKSSLGEEQSSTNQYNSETPGAILVADCGTVFTKVSLLGLVEGQYRLMARGEAPTTNSAPHKDVMKGIVQAINEIEFVTGRHFVNDGRLIAPEQASGDGTD